MRKNSDNFRKNSTEAVTDCLTTDTGSVATKQKGLTLLCYSFGALVLVVLDQWLKLWAVSNLQSQPGRSFIPGILYLTYLENTGAAFGFLSGFGGAQWFLSIYKIAILIAALVYFFKLPYEKRFLWLRIPLVLIMTGGIGNLIDRVRMGFVIDMLEFGFINFPIFNLADIYVTVGASLFVLMVIFAVKDAPLFGMHNKNAAIENAQKGEETLASASECKNVE